MLTYFTSLMADFGQDMNLVFNINGTYTRSNCSVRYCCNNRDLHSRNVILERISLFFLFNWPCSSSTNDCKLPGILRVRKSPRSSKLKSVKSD